MFVYKLIGWGSSPVAVTLLGDVLNLNFQKKIYFENGYRKEQQQLNDFEIAAYLHIPSFENVCYFRLLSIFINKQHFRIFVLLFYSLIRRPFKTWSKV